MDDAALYRLLCSDAEAGMKACIRQYYGLVYTVCSGILSRFPQDTEECVNESFLQLWRTLGAVQEPSHLRAYLCCIARNLALSRYRALTAAGQHMICEPLPEDLAADADVILETESRADAEALRRAVMLLKEPDREIFVRKYYLMEPVRALAKRFSLTEKAVESILFRSRQRLRKILEEESA